MKYSILPVAATTTLLAGCAGYNHTLFMTKSNAGLDFDLKPPTAEVTISRKEAVIAPVFENGQTPPVMASFKPNVGFDGTFGNFFLGVDQTFAGGDAAMAMSALYNSDNAPPASAITNYDSAIKLSKAPAYTDVFRRLAKPGQVRPFIFGTDTMLGLKVAWSGAGGQMPDMVKAGFNRKEFAWAPVTLAEGTCLTNPAATNSLVRMPSFLATIDSKIEAGTNTNGIVALQYFATGKSATLLALRPAVRRAMIERADPTATRKYDEYKKGADQQRHVLTQTGLMVKWATGADGKLDATNIVSLIKGTDLVERQAEIEKMAPAIFQAKLSSTWAIYVPDLWENFPDKPQE